MIGITDLTQARLDRTDLAELRVLLRQLVGQSFQFFRVSYGEELTLHLGELRAYAHPRLKAKQRGTFIVKARASSWTVRSDNFLVTNDEPWSPGPDARPLETKEIEGREIIATGSAVTAAQAARSPSGFMLILGFSDGSSLSVVPTRDDSESDTDAELPEAPPVADWEILMPSGFVLQSGPGHGWRYHDPSGEESANG